MVPPSAPIARKRGRPPKLCSAVLLPAPTLDKRSVNLAKAKNVHQQGGPTPKIPPTVSPGMPPTVIPTVINRQV